MTKASVGMGMGVRLASAVVAITLLSNLPAMGTNLFWSANGTTQGGAGTWDTTTGHFDPVATGTPTGTYGVIWNNANVDSAEFGGTAGQVNITSGIVVNVIKTDTTAYIIGNGNTNTSNAMTFSGANSGITTPAAGTLTTIQTSFSGTLTKAGGGRLEMGNGFNPNANSMKYVITAGDITTASIARLSASQPTTLVADFLTFNGGGWAINTGNQDTAANRGITVKAGGAFFGSSSTTVNLTISSPIVGTEGGGVTLTNAGPFTGNTSSTAGGIVTFTNAGNTYNGPTTIVGASQLKVDGDATIGDGTGTVTLAGGTLGETASRSGAGGIVLNPIQLTASSSIQSFAAAVTPIFEFSGPLTSAAGLTLTLRDNIDTATQFKPRFSGTFTFDGNISMPTGTGALAATTQLESFNTTGTTQTFTGTISGTGSYNRSASSAGTGGTTVFTGNTNTYSGGTSVTRGILFANNTSGSATGSGAVSIGSNGTLSGKGSVDGLVTVSNFGIVAPGGTVAASNGIDTLTLKGGLTLLEGGKLNFDLGAPGTGDKIDLVTSTLTLPVTSTPTTAFVNLTDVGGLAVGTYTLIDYGTNDPTGSLSNVAVSGPGGFTYSLFDNTTTTAIELHVMSAVVGLPGDFNSDGTVDAGDYATWRKNEVANVPLANDGGAATQADRFTLWRANFGNPPGAGSGGGLGGASVPEPSAIVLLAIGMLAAGFRRRG